MPCESDDTIGVLLWRPRVLEIVFWWCLLTSALGDAAITRIRVNQWQSMSIKNF